MRAARVLHPISAWQYVVLQAADAEPRTLYCILGRRGGYRSGSRWFTKLIDAGYLQELPAIKCHAHALYRRTPLGDELAEQLRVMADRLGWEPG